MVKCVCCRKWKHVSVYKTGGTPILTMILFRTVQRIGVIGEFIDSAVSKISIRFQEIVTQEPFSETCPEVTSHVKTTHLLLYLQVGVIKGHTGKKDRQQSQDNVENPF
jgi:hypothetical protein